jgi:hypothetical protein
VKQRRVNPVGWLTPEILTNFNLTRQEAQFCIQSVLVPTGIFPVKTGIYMPNDINGLDRRPFCIWVKNGENFAIDFLIQPGSLSGYSLVEI